MPHPSVGTALALTIFFSSFLLLKQTLISLEPWARPALTRALGAPLKGAVAGFLVTVVIQSSSATNSIAVGLVAANVLRLEDALAVILGANVGTTFTGQIVAFGLDEMALPLMAAGLLLQVFRIPSARRAGAVAMGVGGLFYGLWALGSSLAALSDHLELERWLDSVLASDLKAVAAGLLATAVVQSSSAVTGLIIGLADAGSIGARAAIAAALGSNVGTVATTLLASLSGGPLARRVALFDLAFNALGVLLFLPFLSHLPGWMALAADTPGRQVANAHTFFNATTVALMLPFVRTVGRWLRD